MTAEFYVLGPLEARRGASPIEIAGPKQRALLGHLLLAANQVVSADTLIDRLWGDMPPAKPLHTLRVHISTLRRLLEPSADGDWRILETYGDGYRMNVSELDATRFEELARQGRTKLEEGDFDSAVTAFQDALDLWRGRPFDDIADHLDVIPEVTRLSEARLAVSERLNDARLGAGEADELVGEIQRQTELHPLRERLWEQLMTALYRSGRHTDALKAYASYRDRLGEELGLEPGPDIRALEDGILMHDTSLALPESGPPSNLPAPTTKLVGRQEELRAVGARLEKSRLVTLIGPGGVGKTRLALEVGRAIAARLEQPTWLVELAPLSNPELISAELARVMGIDQQPDRPVIETVTEAIADEDVFIILDNCEHLIEEAGRTVAALLRGCPRIRVLATSREPLGISGEVRIRVTPLSTEDGDSEAVDLFLDRAAAVAQSVEFSDSELSTITAICRRLDGLPLAIELATARLGVLAPDQISDSLNDRFSLLTGGEADAPEHHQTLEATLAWSVDMLDEEERAIFAWLAIFRGTFGLAAIEDLTAVASVGAEAPVIDLVAALVDKSLVNAVAVPGEMRYEMLESIRSYGTRLLAETGVLVRARDWHTRWYLGLAKDLAPKLRGGEQLDALTQLELEHDNLRSALDHSFEIEDPESAVKLSGYLAWFWFLHSHLAEGWDWLSRSLDQTRLVTPVTRARALLGAAQFAWEQSRDEQAREWLEEALLLADKAAAPSLGAWAHAYLALLAALEADQDGASEHAEVALASFTDAGNASGAGFSLWVQVAAEYASKRGQLDRATADRAREVIENLMIPARAVGERNTIGHLAWTLGIEALDRGDVDTAAASFSESLQAFRDLGNKSCAGHTIDEVARLLAVRGNPRHSLRLLAATDSLRSRLGIPGHVWSRRNWESTMTAAADVVDAAAAEEARSEGHILDFDAMIDLALTSL